MIFCLKYPCVDIDIYRYLSENTVPQSDFRCQKLSFEVYIRDFQSDLYIHICICVCVCIYIYIRIQEWVFLCDFYHVMPHLSDTISLYIYISLYSLLIYMYVYIYIYPTSSFSSMISPRSSHFIFYQRVYLYISYDPIDLRLHIYIYTISSFSRFSHW